MPKGDYVEELTLGLLRPPQESGKFKRPPKKLKTSLLLSVLRKLLAICMIEITWDHLKNYIPVDQAAYQPSKVITDQIFPIKLLAEKAIINIEYKIYLLLLDMSKEFDIVNRKTLF